MRRASGVLMAAKNTGTGGSTELTPRRVALFGNTSEQLKPLLSRHPNLELTDDAPDIVVCYGGDGTLLAAELQWPGLPKAPILNSRRGHRCIPHAPEEVIDALAGGTLVRNAYMKLECALHTAERRKTPDFKLTCLNEINVHMGRINSAVRFKLWINDEPFENGVEIVSDGFVVCTAFGSTAYFKAITKGIFTKGMGVAFKATTYPVNHLVLPQQAKVTLQITRGPATLAFDNSTEYIHLEKNDTLRIKKHKQDATIMTCEPVTKLDEPF